jgi:hypothetical protein
MIIMMSFFFSPYSLVQVIMGGIELNCGYALLCSKDQPAIAIGMARVIIKNLRTN